MKKAGVLDKERAFFREKDGETLVDRDLRVVRFHLAEIRIQRDVEGQGILGHNFASSPARCSN